MIGKRVRQLREDRGLSQDELATLVGVHRPRITEIETGKGNATTATLAKLAEALGVPIGSLFREALPR